MPQPAANQQVAERLIAAYRDAHAQLLEEYEAALADPRRVRQTARLRELLRTNEAVLDGLVEASRTWWGATLPEIHAAGAQSAASVVGSSFSWTAPHVDAVNEYVQRTWSDVAAKLSDIRAETRAALRREIQSATRSVLLEGKTPAQVARELARQAAADGLWSVKYANGARHSIEDYFDSVVRTTTAEAYNRGSVVQSVADGFTHVEYFDGDDCGLESHEGMPKANGMIVPVEEVVYLSHPRCQRAILPALEGRTLAPDGLGLDDVGDSGVERPTVPKREQRTSREPRAARSQPVPLTIDDLAAQIVADAERAAEALQGVLEDVVTGVGRLVGTDFRVKGADGVARKLRKVLGNLPLDGMTAPGLAARVPDTVRFTAQLDEALYAAAADQILASLRAKGYRVDLVKNYWRNPDGYRGVNVLLTAPDGQRFELQLHTERSFAAKQATHGIYEEQRLLPKFSARWVALQAEQNVAFAPVPVPPNAGSVGS